MRISCGARQNVQTVPTTTLWFKDFGYTGGIPANASRPSFITPPLKTLRFFPLSGGPSNCYNINGVPKGHYSVRIFFGLVEQASATNEPLFDISIQGTQIYSLKSGWTSQDDQAFTEAQVFLTDGSASICFHSTGHGDPAILSIEILQIDDNAYYFVPQWSKGIILRTVKRLSCGFGQSKFGVDYGADPRGGDRFWEHIKTFGDDSDRPRSVETRINQASRPPNFYPETLYRSALVSTSSQPDLTYTLDVDPNKNYSIWLHFAEIENSVTAIGQRVFNILINGDVVFEDVDIVKLSGGRFTALVLNTTVPVNGRTLTITLSPKEGSSAIITAVEIFEYAQYTCNLDLFWVLGKALQTLKKALGLPPRFGWNGDPCVPQQHPWTGADCQLEKSSGKWVIDGLNLSGNSIGGAIPSSLGTVTSLQVLFTDNSGLCGIPGLPTCGPHLTTGAKIGIGLGTSFAFLLLITFSVCWWKRRQNIIRVQQIAARAAPYAKARTHFSRDIQMTRHNNNHANSHTASENGPILLS
ncbi:hypothetical protein TanjilG_26581 [Lupinus angustifolius]|uniref:Malectin-like domain-containing protein n=1 Tax=Lupinus angustifolius TaxID=3871 RepID=A0A4P1QQ50_LUPAN|nr:hypothetical protein TanjilG_26581 [Lupinus angustifolius]